MIPYTIEGLQARGGAEGRGSKRGRSSFPGGKGVREEKVSERKRCQRGKGVRNHKLTWAVELVSFW
jgi:hypothetical protein